MLDFNQMLMDDEELQAQLVQMEKVSITEKWVNKIFNDTNDSGENLMLVLLRLLARDSPDSIISLQDDMIDALNRACEGSLNNMDDNNGIY